MKTNATNEELLAAPAEETADSVEFAFAISRRRFVQVLGAGLVIAVSGGPAWAQDRGGRGGRGGSARAVATRIHIANDGTITVLTGKIEMGQGARTELTQAAAEELRVAVGQVQMLMGDTSLVPDDGLTAGSRTTPSTMPAVRQGAAAATPSTAVLRPCSTAYRDDQARAEDLHEAAPVYCEIELHAVGCFLGGHGRHLLVC